MKVRAHQRDKHRAGYALLVTLIMLALLGVILGAMARRSADTALAARDAEDNLRVRWAQLSCRQTLLASASTRFDARSDRWMAALAGEGSSGSASIERPIATESLTLELTGLNLWLRIDDEQAKLNLNERLRNSPDTVVSPAAVAAEVLRGLPSLQIALTRPEFYDTLGLQPVQSWAQVYLNAHPTTLLGIQQPDDMMERVRSDVIANRVTLWGDGRINLRLANEQTLRQALAGRVRPATIDLLLRLHRDEPGLDLNTLIENATAEEQDDRSVLSAALTDQSQNYAMWLAVQPAKGDNRAVRWSLSVHQGTSDANNSGNATTLEYRW